MFVVFDGVDGCGKSTQLERCADWLRRQGLEVVTCRDPGSTPLGDQIRSILLSHNDVPIGHRAEIMLFMVARAQLVESVIRPALDQRKWVLCDRFGLSTQVYQGYAGKLDPAVIQQVGQTATGELCPDLTFVFDLPVELALKRIGTEKDRFESRGTEYLQRVREGFRKLAERESNSIKLIDASGSIDDIHDKVQRELISHLPGCL